MCNFTGQVLYPFPAAFVHRDVAISLQKVQEELQAEGLCLKIFDGYRPFSVQEKMLGPRSRRALRLGSKQNGKGTPERRSM